MCLKHLFTLVEPSRYQFKIKDMKNDIETQLEQFLKSIDYYKRQKDNNYFTNAEIATIMLLQIEAYKAGSVSIEFIAELADTLQNEAMFGSKPTYDEELTGILCEIGDLRYTVPNIIDKTEKTLKRTIEYPAK